MLHQLTLIALLLGLFGVLSPVFAAEEDTELQEDDSGPDCPPGYWCKKKREFDSAECPRGFVCRSKRGPTDCPPGYWCRRSELVVTDPTKPDECPDNSWCKESKVEIAQPRSMFSYPDCPPGYWCRRKRAIDLISRRGCPSDYNCDETQEDAGPDCPPGYWCKKKRNIIHEATKKNECRRGFWCKRESQSF